MDLHYTTLILASDDEAGMRSSRPKALFTLCGKTILDRLIRAATGSAKIIVAAEGEIPCPEDAVGIRPSEKEKIFAEIKTDVCVVLSASFPLVRAESAACAALLCAATGNAVTAGGVFAAPKSVLTDIYTADTAWRDCVSRYRLIADVADCPSEKYERMEVRDRVGLAGAEAVLRSRINRRYMCDGVTITDPARTYIDEDVVIGRDSVILPGTMLFGKTVIGEGCEIGPDTKLTDAVIGDGTSVVKSVGISCTVGTKTTVGPFAYLRPDSVVGDGCRIGDFVELKNTNIGNGTKVSHLTYVGDSDVGERVNFGCGTVTVNYDGAKKYRTTIGNDVFVGCNSNLVAPVTLADGAYTAAGSTITDNVPEHTLAIARARQVLKENWNDRRNHKK